MNPRRSLGLVAFVLAVAVAVPLVVASRVGDLPVPLVVVVDGHMQYIPPGMTFGQAMKAFALTAHSGDLLDVEGEVLEDKAFPGLIVLNGHPAPRRTALAEGDRIRLIDRSDRTEPLSREVVPLRGRHPIDPQFYLGNAPGERIVTTGRMSGKLVSSVFRPTGRTHVPRAVALTFDDGPSARYTRQILSILKHFHVRATFFTIGYVAKEHPRLVRREHRSHMVVADHSWSHPNSPPFEDLQPDRIHDEIDNARLALEGLGVHVRLFRPPGGSFSPEVVETARRLGMRVVLWSVDPRDWRPGINSRAIVANVLSNVRPGSIVILHDGGGDQSATVRALPQIIKGIRKKHLKLVPVR